VLRDDTDELERSTSGVPVAVIVTAQSVLHRIRIVSTGACRLMTASPDAVAVLAPHVQAAPTDVDARKRAALRHHQAAAVGPGLTSVVTNLTAKLVSIHISPSLSHVPNTITGQPRTKLPT